ncbi:MAG: phosphodiester glycosidase family protein, partial [Clostridia bacterium]|nr:phosphodiester glycosidase family protein [Clostridia bacterium]
MKKIISFFMAVVMILCNFSAICVFAAEEGMGTIDAVTEETISEGLSYKTVRATHSKHGIQTAYVMELSDRRNILPTVAVNNNIRSSSRMTTKIKNETEKGKKVFGGVNGDFFAMATGIPLGSVIENKEVLSAGTDANAIGFRANGTVVIGRADFNISMTIGKTSYDVDYLNKNASKWGLYLLTDRYQSTTKGDGTYGTEIVIRVDSGVLKLSEEVSGTVVDVRKNTNSNIIQKNHMVLFVPNIDSDINKANNTLVGEKVTLKVTDDSGLWKDVTQMIGGGDILVKNGQVQSGFDSSISGKTSRTAAGVKEDGTIVLFALDKKEGLSNGLDLKSVAEYLKSMGCITAINLDGGGSTTMHIRKGDALKIVNNPLDGSERSVTNGIIFVSRDSQNQLYLSMGSDALYLASNSVYTDKVYGVRDGVKWDISDKVSYSYEGTGAKVNKNQIIADNKDGKGVLTATYDGKSAKRNVEIVSKADNIIMAGSMDSQMNIKAGTSKIFQFFAYKEGKVIASSQNAFKGEISGDIGKYDNSTGQFFATEFYKKGKLKLTGLSTERVFDITVGQRPFIIEDFEEGGTLDITYEKEDLEATFERQRDLIKGAYSGKISYNVKGDKEEIIKVYLPEKVDISKGKNLSFQMAGEGVFSFNIDTEGFGDYSFYYEEKANPDAFETYDMDIVSQLGKCQLYNILELKVKGQGEIYIDDILLETDGIMNNDTMPEIKFSTSLDNIQKGDLIKFKVEKPIDQYEVIVNHTQAFINEVPVTVTYKNGEYSIPVLNEFDRGYAVLEIIARDRSGNHIRKNYILKGNKAPTEYTPYSDTKDNWAYDYIELATSRKLMKGSDGKFYPENNLTRYEFAQFISNYYDLWENFEYNVSEEISYEDFEKIPDWAKKAVAKMHKKGIMVGKETSDGVYFNGDDYVTRAEVITAIGRIVDNKIFQREVNYTDMNKVPDWAKKYVSVCSGLSIVKGYPEGDIRPNQNI